MELLPSKSMPFPSTAFLNFSCITLPPTQRWEEEAKKRVKKAVGRDDNSGLLSMRKEDNLHSSFA
ncbi:unnamed protein product [Musa acuminata var. zebrina]